MTISSTTNRVNYTGNGATSVYSYTFRIFSKADLKVTRRDTGDAETLLTVDVDYTVSGVGDTAGGTITLTAGNLPSGYKLTIRRIRSLKQETDFRNQGDFYPETHEDALDGLVMQNQAQQDELDRALKLPETATGVSPVLPMPVAKKWVRWNAGATALENTDAADLGSASAIGAGLQLTDNELSVIDSVLYRAAYDLREFLPEGYVSDGSANYAAEIADALLTIRTAGGGTLIIPKGTWRHDTGLVLRGVDASDVDGSLGGSSVNIVGVSKRDSILKYTGTGEGLYLDTSDSSKHGIISIRNFHLKGTGTEPGSVGLRLGTTGGESSKVVVDDISISKHGLGLELHHQYGSKLYNVQVRYCGVGAQIGASNETNSFNNNLLVGCEFSWNTGKGLYILSGDHNVLDTCLIENNGDEGIYAERGATNIPSFYVFRDCWIENNQKDKTAQNKGQVYLHSTLGTGTDALDRFTFERCILEDPGNNYHFEVGNTLNFTLKDCRYSGGGGNDYIFKRKAATESGWCDFHAQNIEQLNLIKEHTGTPFPGSAAGYPDSYNGRIMVAGVPSTGTWSAGDITYNRAGTANGVMGWVCTVDGTPGTWVTFPTGAVSGLLGTWDASTYSAGTIYGPASTDLDVYLKSTSGGEVPDLQGIKDSSATPTTVRTRYLGNDGAELPSIAFRVKKGDYWKAQSNKTGNTVYALPIGS